MEHSALSVALLRQRLVSLLERDARRAGRRRNFGAPGAGGIAPAARSAAGAGRRRRCSRRSIAPTGASAASPARSARSASSTLHCCYLPSSRARAPRRSARLRASARRCIEERQKRRTRHARGDHADAARQAAQAARQGRRRPSRTPAVPRQRAERGRGAVGQPRAKTLKAAIDRAGGIYLADRLHRVRIEAKKLRYALEIQRELTPLARRPPRLDRVEGRAGPARPHARSRDPDRPRARRAEQRCRRANRMRHGRTRTSLIRVLEDECREGHAVVHAASRPALAEAVRRHHRRRRSPVRPPHNLDTCHGRPNRAVPGSSRNCRGTRTEVSRRSPAPADAGRRKAIREVGPGSGRDGRGRSTSC